MLVLVPVTGSVSMILVVVVFLCFKQKTAYEMRISDWSADVCSSDLPGHVHNRARGAFVDVEGVRQPAPAPRYSETPTAAPKRLEYVPAVTDAVFASPGLQPSDIDDLRRAAVVS